MPRQPLADTTPAQKAAIVTRKSLGMTTRQIANNENVSPSTVSRITNRYGETSDFAAKGTKKGRECKMSKRDVDLACRMLSSGHCKNATSIQRTFFPLLHVDTIRNALRKRGLKAYTRQSKPLLTRKQKAKRLDWAESHCYWEDENWGAVVFSDESKFNLFGSDGRQWCWREPGQANDARYTKKKLKHGGGNLMVWGCITRHGVGRLHRIDGIMDRFMYVDILSESLLGTLDNHNLDRNGIYFQHDCDPKHTSKHATGWLELEDIDVLPWSPNSPDMNIIENLWDHLDRMVRARDPLPTNLDELWAALLEEWEKIDQDYIDRLYKSLPNRVRDVLKAKGGSTRY
jgi:transposase